MDKKEMKREGWFKYPLPWEYMEKMLTVRDSPDEIGRDGFIISVACYTGLRPNEIVQLKWLDFFYLDLEVREELRVRISKQSKLQGHEVYRALPIHYEFERRAREYYEECGNPALSGYVFKAGDKKSKKKHIDPRTVNRRIKYWAHKKDIPNPTKVSAYSLRKGFIDKFAKVNGENVAMEMTGHKTMADFRRYRGINRKSVTDGFAKMFDPSFVSLTTMIEEGLIDVNVEQIINGLDPLKWQDAVVNYLLQFTEDMDEIYQFTRVNLAPHRARILSKRSKQLLTK